MAFRPTRISTPEKSSPSGQLSYHPALEEQGASLAGDFAGGFHQSPILAPLMKSQVIDTVTAEVSPRAPALMPNMKNRQGHQGAAMHVALTVHVLGLGPEGAPAVPSAPCGNRRGRRSFPSVRWPVQPACPLALGYG